MQNMKKIVIKNLTRIFGKTQEDTMKLQNVYKAAGIENSKPAVQKMWIANRMKEFEKYDLVEPIYNNNVLEKITLRENGKIVLGKIPGDIAAIFSGYNYQIMSTQNLQGIIIKEQSQAYIQCLNELTEAFKNNSVKEAKQKYTQLVKIHDFLSITLKITTKTSIAYVETLEEAQKQKNQPQK